MPEIDGPTTGRAKVMQVLNNLNLEECFREIHSSNYANTHNSRIA